MRTCSCEWNKYNRNRVTCETARGDRTVAGIQPSSRGDLYEAYVVNVDGTRSVVSRPVTKRNARMAAMEYARYFCEEKMKRIIERSGSFGCGCGG